MVNIPLQVKYRPIDYKSVVGQIHIITLLKGLVRNGGYTFSNSLIFHAGAGCGKTTLARIYAKSVNCLNPVEGEACNTCEHCKMFNKNNYVDFIEVDGASYNKIEDVKNLIKIFNQHPIIKNGYRCILIDECHRLSKQAWDVFLKPLEEGLTKTIFLFATTEFDKIPPAIVSRSIICSVKPATINQIFERLKEICQCEGINYSEENLYKITYKNKGKLRDSIKFLDVCVKTYGKNLEGYLDLENEEEELLKIIKLALLCKTREALEILETLFIKDTELREFVNNIFITLISYPTLVCNTMLPKKELEDFFKLVDKSIVKDSIKMWNDFNCSCVSDFKLFLTILSEIGLKIDRKLESKSSIAETRFRETRFIPKMNFEDTSGVKSSEKNNCITISKNWEEI